MSEARLQDGARYPFEPVGARRGAGVPDPQSSAQETYASFGEPLRGPAPDIF